MTENEITLFLAEEINGGCISPNPISYGKCRAIAKRLLKQLQITSSNSNYAKCQHNYVTDISCGKDIVACSKCGDML